MQVVTSFLPSRGKTKRSSKWEVDTACRGHGSHTPPAIMRRIAPLIKIDERGVSVSKSSNKTTSEAFWPTTLGKESRKAARILTSFCSKSMGPLSLFPVEANGKLDNGFYEEEDREPSQKKARGKERALKKIPQTVIQNAVGLAIFMTMQTGLWVSGPGGSGVLVAREEDGSWSPPSAISVHTAGLQFPVGVDIYDCVLIINNRQALDAFTKVQATIGGEISAVAGPAGVGGILENGGRWKHANRPIFAYLKSRGLYDGVQVNGAVVTERTDENKRFYGESVEVADILAGKVRHPPYELNTLMETLKAVECSNTVDQDVLQRLGREPTPGDFELRPPSAGALTFGIPQSVDPDPFGILALEKQGLQVREAGTSSVHPPVMQPKFNQRPRSPAYNKSPRQASSACSTSSNNCSMSDRRFLPSTGASTSTQTNNETAVITRPSDGNRLDKKEGDQGNIEPQNAAPANRKIGRDRTNDSKLYLSRTTKADCPREDPQVDRNRADSSSQGTKNEVEEDLVGFGATAAHAATVTPHMIQARRGLINIPKRPPLAPLPLKTSGRRTSILMVGQPSDQSIMRFGSEDVALHTPSEDQMKALILQDLELSNISKRPLETSVAKALQDQNLDKIPFLEQHHLEAGKFSVPVIETPMSDSRSLFWSFSHNNSEYDPTTPEDWSPDSQEP